MQCSMTVPVMDVGEMRVSVNDRLMLVRVRVRLVAVPFEPMHVLMVAVVTVHVIMLEKLVSVLVLMMLREVQPDAGPHEHGGHAEGD